MADRKAHMPTLAITQDIIDTSCVADSSHCMIADAVRKAFPAAHSVTVDIQTIRFSLPEKNTRYVYLTPRIAQMALLDFDAGIKPEPFTFTLRGAFKAPMRTRNPRKPMSPEHREKVAAGAAKARSYAPRAQVVKHQGNEEHGIEAKRVGGRTPPIGALAAGKTGRRRDRDSDIPTARRRTWGLRAIPQRNLDSRA